MKKALLILSLVGITFLVACGPSAKEKAAVEQARLDSIATAEMEKAHQDSILTVQNLAAQAAREDSLMAAAAAAAKASVPKAAPAPTTPPKSAPVKGRPGAVRK